jgi:hypothetical protein
VKVGRIKIAIKKYDILEKREKKKNQGHLGQFGNLFSLFFAVSFITLESFTTSYHITIVGVRCRYKYVVFHI